jgi:hypothetical protein
MIKVTSSALPATFPAQRVPTPAPALPVLLIDSQMDLTVHARACSIKTIPLLTVSHVTILVYPARVIQFVLHVTPPITERYRRLRIYVPV